MLYFYHTAFIIKHKCSLVWQWKLLVGFQSSFHKAGNGEGRLEPTRDCFFCVYKPDRPWEWHYLSETESQNPESSILGFNKIPKLDNHVFWDSQWSDPIKSAFSVTYRFFLWGCGGVVFKCLNTLTPWGWVSWSKQLRKLRCERALSCFQVLFNSQCSSIHAVEGEPWELRKGCRQLTGTEVIDTRKLHGETKLRGGMSLEFEMYCLVFASTIQCSSKVEERRVTDDTGLRMTWLLKLGDRWTQVHHAVCIP